jgi:hypothetical protein
MDVTAYYAKADVALLQQIAQPWPEVEWTPFLRQPVNL